MTDRLLANAKSMRRQPTEAEKALWRLLRAKRLEGWKFRRQQPLGSYIVDFVCFGSRLVIEADGGQHADGADDVRDAWLQNAGFRVLRLWNNDILTNEEGIVAVILEALATPPD